MVEEVKKDYRDDLFEEALIGKLNYWASYNLRYHNGKDIRKRFREAYNIMFYFDRESDFLALKIYGNLSECFGLFGNR